MESITFEKFGIDRCQNETCDQQYNEDSIRLAVWLYGVIFLTQSERNEDGDPLFDDLKQQKDSEVKEIFGYVGMTCPKCLKTSLYKNTAQGVREFKNFLSSWSITNPKNQDENSHSNWMSKSIPMNLRYYSPFWKASKLLKELQIHYYAYDKQTSTLEFFDDFVMFVAGEEKDLKTPFCTYDISDKTEPAGSYTSIYWLDEKDILLLASFENENRVRVLPRYHYFHEQMEKIDSLLKYNYFSGQQIDQALADAEKCMKNDLRNYESHYYRKKNIEEQKKQFAFDHKGTSDFFEILVSNPVELKSFVGEPLKNCDYLWVKKNIFRDKGLPTDFSLGNQPDEEIELSSDIRKNHKRMVDLIQENFHKQYVQKFLKNNLIDFLEEYESLIQSNTFSYSAVWELKESYLEGLYKETNKGLREVKPYSFHFNSPGWTIKFNNQSVTGLRDIGLKHIHYLICNQNKGVNLFDLNNVDGIDTSIEKREKQYGNQKMGDKSSKSNEKVFGSNKQFFESTEMMDDKGLKKMKEQKRKLEEALSYAEQNNDIPAIEKANEELDEFTTHLKEYYIPWKREKRRFTAKENKNLRRGIELAISRAIEKIKDHNNELYWHFAQSIYGLPRAFYKTAGTKYLFLENFEMMYKPDPDIDWHLD